MSHSAHYTNINKLLAYKPDISLVHFSKRQNEGKSHNIMIIKLRKRIMMITVLITNINLDLSTKQNYIGGYLFSSDKKINNSNLKYI